MSAQDDYPAVIRGDCRAPGVHMNEERVDALYRELDTLRAWRGKRRCDGCKHWNDGGCEFPHSRSGKIEVDHDGTWYSVYTDPDFFCAEWVGK